MIKKFCLILLSVLFFANTVSAQGLYGWKGGNGDWDGLANWRLNGFFTPTVPPGNGDLITISSAGTVTLRPSTMLSTPPYLNAAVTLSGDGELFITDGAGSYYLDNSYTRDQWDYNTGTYVPFTEYYYRANGLPFAMATGIGKQNGIVQTGGTLNLQVGTFYFGGSPFAANDTTTIGLYTMSGGKLAYSYSSEYRPSENGDGWVKYYRKPRKSPHIYTFFHPKKTFCFSGAY